MNRINNTDTVETHLAESLGAEGFALYTHDVRSALFGLMGSLELIKEDSISAEVFGQISRARASGDLLRDLLDLVFDDKYADVSTVPLDINTELKSVVNRWSDRVESKELQLVVSLPDDLSDLATTNRIGFQRVFNNLVGNAVKFLTHGTIRIDVINGEGKVEFIVTDNGPGFSEAALGVLFRFRGRPDDSPQEGSGLGLYITKKLVEEMGGSITAINHDDGGAQITVSLPTTVVQKTATVQNPDALPDLSHLNILLAEDNVTNQLVVTQMLKSMGASYKVASDGMEAIEMFDKEDFDVVLLDIEMPRKSGLEVLREIRGRGDEKSGVPLVALTAYVMQEHRTRIEAAGADGIIAKPISGIAPLGHMINQYVGGSRRGGPLGEGVNPKPQNSDAGYVNTKTFEVLADTIGSDTFAEFLGKVIQDFENISNDLINAEATDDNDIVRASSHILISVAGAIGAENLQHLAEDLNRAAKSGNRPQRQILNLQCIKGISDVVMFLGSKK